MGHEFSIKIMLGEPKIKKSILFQSCNHIIIKEKVFWNCTENRLDPRQRDGKV